MVTRHIIRLINLIYYWINTVLDAITDWQWSTNRYHNYHVVL